MKDGLIGDVLRLVRRVDEGCIGEHGGAWFGFCAVEKEVECDCLVAGGYAQRRWH
jgi:hypothetical protein